MRQEQPDGVKVALAREDLIKPIRRIMRYPGEVDERIDPRCRLMDRMGIADVSLKPLKPASPLGPTRIPLPSLRPLITVDSRSRTRTDQPDASNSGTSRLPI